ncbi:MAG TPA: hypothetical protein VNK96_01945 [Fimbriimonadales bacterium]|nr:hypothetical protein [Fimbriimonadales bacterium]
MKYITLAAIVSFLAWQIASGTPCWDFSNSCGDLPACRNIPPDAEYVLCTHYYCDSEAVCTWDTTKTRYCGVMRRKYWWFTEEHNVILCLGPQLDPPIWIDRKCCLCNQPGILYEQ